MKKITFFLIFFSVFLGFSQSTLEDFEGDAPSLVDDGTTSSVQTNPDSAMGSGNESANALQIITNAASNPWQGAKLIMQNNKIDMTTADKTMTVDIYSNAPAEFLAKLVDGDVGGTDPAQESKSAAAHTGSGWETLVFDFNIGADTTQPGYNPPNDQFSGVVFFPLYDISNNGWCDGCGAGSSLDTTTYVDNVTAVAGDAILPPDPCTNGVMDGDETGIDCGGSCPNACPGSGTLDIVEDFESDPPSTDLFDGFASATVVANPDSAMGSGNESANALELITSSAGQPWQGAKLIMQNNKIDMTTANKTMEVDIYSDSPMEFLAKLVDGDVGGTDPAQESKTAVAHTGSGWETLVLDFNVPADTTQPGYNPPNDQFSGIVFFPLYSIAGNGWNPVADTTTYIDNVKAVLGDIIIPPLDLLEDFEGSAPSLVDDGTTSSVQANPDMAGANMSANALQILTNAASNPWQGAKLIMQNNKIDMTTSNKYMTADIYSDTPMEFLVKLTDGDVGGMDPAQESKTAASHGGTGWETIIFDFNVPADTTQPGYNPPNDQFSGIVFFPLYSIAGNGWNAAADTTTYVDNVKGIAGDAIAVDTCSNGIMDGDETGIDCGGSCAPCAAPPAVAAPTPPARDPADVISIYSDAYTDIGVDTYDTPWCPGTTTEVLIDGNPTQLLTGASCDGIDWQSSRTIDATDFSHFHIDFYTDEPDLVGKVFNLKFSQWGGTGGEVSALQFNINDGTSPGIQTGVWVSVDIDLRAMPLNPLVGGSLDRDDIVQFVFSTNLDKVWWDNLYLHKDTVLSTDDFESTTFKAYPNPTNGDWNITGNTLISKVTVYDVLGKEVIRLTPNTTETIVNASSLTTGVYFARVESLNGAETIKLVKQ